MTIVHVRHPVPVEYTPRGGRKARLEYVAHVTPVRLKEVSPSEMESLGVNQFLQPSRREVFRQGGRLWLKVGGRHDFLEDRRLPFSRADFLAFLGGDPSHDLTDLGSMLHRTPLSTGLGHRRLLRGEDIDLASARSIGLDGRELGPRDLARFIDDEVLVAGDDVYLRLLGPVVLANSSANAARPILSEPRWTMGQFRGEIVTRLDRAADFPVPGRNLHAPALAGHGLPVEAWSEDDDIRLVGNAAPQWVLNDLELVADFLSVTRPEDSARLRRAAPALSPWLARGAINAIGRDEVEEVLLASRACAVEVLAVEFAGQTRLPYLRRWIDELALPLLRRNDPLPEDDADAFTNLQP